MVDHYLDVLARYGDQFVVYFLRCSHHVGLEDVQAEGRTISQQFQWLLHLSAQKIQNIFVVVLACFGQIGVILGVVNVHEVSLGKFTAWNHTAIHRTQKYFGEVTLSTHKHKGTTKAIRTKTNIVGELGSFTRFVRGKTTKIVII